jgi:hypothetical protein
VHTGPLALADVGVDEGPQLSEEHRLGGGRLLAGQGPDGLGVAGQVTDQDPQPPQRQEPAAVTVASPVVAEVEVVDALEVGLDSVRVVADQLSEADDSPTDSRPMVCEYAANSSP